MKSLKSLFTIGALLALAGCGGGGGGSSASNSTETTASTATFPLRSGYQALVGQSEVNSFQSAEPVQAPPLRLVVLPQPLRLKAFLVFQPQQH